MLAREDAEKFVIPHICLASSGESAELVKAYAEVLASEGHIGEVETYPNSIHGWMGARSNLENADEAKTFEQG